MGDIKNIVGIIAVILVFVGYIPYLRDILDGKTAPHLYSWFLWAFVTSIAFALQVVGGAGLGAGVTIAAAVMCVIVIILSLIKKADIDITKIDTVFFMLAFLTLAVWLIAKQPVLSAILATITDLLGFAPTIRKSWNKPYSETLSLYALNTFRFGLSIFALQNYSIMTTLYPVCWLIANGAFATMLIIRRKILRRVILNKV